MHNFYHGVINDKARLHVADLKVILVTDVYNKHLLLGLLIPLVLMACCLPCFVVWLDKKDYEAIENDTYKVEDWVIVAFRKDCKEIKCNQEIFYNLKAIESYTKLTDFSRLNLQVFSVFLRQMMPITSLFYHFDFSEKRLTRLANLTFQIDVITVLIIALIKFWGVFKSKLEDSIHKADPDF